MLKELKGPVVRCRFRKRFALLAALAAAAVPCFASLGGSEDSIAADQAKFQARRQVVSQSGYAVHEITTPDGTVIREYVSPAGMVFGVSWKGPTIPDLSQLLGSHFAEFRSSLRSRAGHRRVASVHNADLVVESTGHTRAFSGRAYVSSLLPSGVTEEVVQ